MIAVAATVIAAALAGVLAEHRHGAAALRLARAFLRLMLVALMPFIAFFTIARLHLDAGAGAGIGLAYIVLAICGLLAWRVGSRPLRLPTPSSGALIVSTVNGNTGYLGLPLVAALLGTSHLGQAIAYDALVNTPVLLIGCFGVGATFGTHAGESLRERLRAFLVRNPPLLAVIAGFLAPASIAPSTIIAITHAMVFALAPLGFFAVGVTLAAEAEGGLFSFPPQLTPAVAVGTALRVLLAPGLLAAFALAVGTIPTTYLVQAAMPCGVSGLMVGHAYGLDVGLTASTISWSTALVLVVALAIALLR